MVHLVLASDRNLVRQAGIAALSAQQHTAARLKVTFLTPSQDAGRTDWVAVTSALRDEGSDCEVVPVATELRGLQLAAHLTAVTYYRLLLPELLPDYDRVIYLDCDTLVNRDLSELWTHPLEGRALAAVADPEFSAWQRLGLDAAAGYFNAGVLLLDLQVIRQHGLFAAALRFSEQHPDALTWSDQCALNKVFTERWARLDPHWNYQHAMMVRKRAAGGLAEAVDFAATAVVHFNNYNRPWLPESWHPLQQQYFGVFASRPELDPRVSPTIGHRWTRLKRWIKWNANGMS